MDIIHIPMLDYLKYCMDIAEDNGYKWVMVLLARELDAVKSYEQLKKYWNSFNDLTGDLVLFIMSINNESHENANGITHEYYRWMMINSSNLKILNEFSPSIDYENFPSHESIVHYRNLAIENNSNAISNLCRFFDIPEELVPSILLFETDSGLGEPPCIIPLESDDLYASIKNLFINIQPTVDKYRDLLGEQEQLKDELGDMIEDQRQFDLTDIEKLYIRSKNSLMKSIAENGFDESVVQDILNTGNEELCLSFPHPINYKLSNIIKMRKDNPDIENIIAEKQQNNNSAEKKQDQKRKILNDKEKEIEKVEEKLFSEVRLYGERKVKQKRSNRSLVNSRKFVRHFKIGFTFSGKYREKIIEPLCFELLNWGYDYNDIFYDSWHDVLINGVHGDSVLREIYSKKCDLVVVLLSPDYKEKNWTGNIEWPAVKELINTNNADKICLLRIDHTDIGKIDGLYVNQTIVKDIDKLSIKDIAVFIHDSYYLKYTDG